MLLRPLRPWLLCLGLVSALGGPPGLSASGANPFEEALRLGPPPAPALFYSAGEPDGPAQIEAFSRRSRPLFEAIRDQGLSGAKLEAATDVGLEAVLAELHFGLRVSVYQGRAERILEDLRGLEKLEGELRSGLSSPRLLVFPLRLQALLLEVALQAYLDPRLGSAKESFASFLSGFGRRLWVGPPLEQAIQGVLKKSFRRWARVAEEDPQVQARFQAEGELLKRELARFSRLSRRQAREPILRQDPIVRVEDLEAQGKRVQARLRRIFGERLAFTPWLDLPQWTRGLLDTWLRARAALGDPKPGVHALRLPGGVAWTSPGVDGRDQGGRVPEDEATMAFSDWAQEQWVRSFTESFPRELVPRLAELAAKSLPARPVPQRSRNRPGDQRLHALCESRREALEKALEGLEARWQVRFSSQRPDRLLALLLATQKVSLSARSCPDRGLFGVDRGVWTCSRHSTWSARPKSFHEEERLARICETRRRLALGALLRLGRERDLSEEELGRWVRRETAGNSQSTAQLSWFLRCPKDGGVPQFRGGHLRCSQHPVAVGIPHQGASP